MASELYAGRGHDMPAFQFDSQGAGRLRGALGVIEHEHYYGSEPAVIAAFFRSLVMDHPFKDGNKRFAIVATQVLMIFNGRYVLATGDEWEILALSTARGDLDIDALEVFFEERL